MIEMLLMNQLQQRTNQLQQRTNRLHVRTKRLRSMGQLRWMME
jgi:hypothetical protein